MQRFSTHVSGLADDGVLVVTIDNPPVNALSQDVRAGLMAALVFAKDDPAIAGMVITGAGKTFIGGADIKEFGKPPAEPLLPTVIDAVEAFEKPVVAAINGAAFGGGLEVALACHHRVAAAGAKHGLPEVKLGLVPGAGGTQRLPRLIGLAAALDMIVTGKPVDAAAAQANGMIDAVSDALIADAITAAKRLAGTPLRRTGQLPVPPAVDDLDGIASKLLARSRGQTAPAEAARLVRQTAERTLAEGLADERETFLRLRDSEQAAALRHVFFAERDAAKIPALEGIQPRAVNTIGIVGTGLMGSGIAVAALTAGYTVIGIEQTDEAAEKGRKRITGLLDRNLASGRMTPSAHAQAVSRLTVAGTPTALAGADLVIEAVFDDLDVKAALFRTLDGIVRPDVILATNTSYLDPDTIAAATAHPSRVLGLHFFSPANIMRLVEVVDCAATAPDVLATGLAVAKRLGKLPIVCGVCEGFIGNRIFSRYRREAEFLIEDGALPQDVDRAMEGFGMAMGPFAVFDLAGLEIAWARRKRQAATRDPAARYVDIADRLCEAGRFGQKSGLGWYRYDEGRKQVDPEVETMIRDSRAAKGILAREIADTEIVSRILEAMADEGRAVIAEGIARSTGDIDLVMINGYGFPAHRGGPMFLADRRKA